MRMLVLGGTRFLGRHIAEHAVECGHDVTLFHRGKSLPEGVPGAASIIGDRSSDLNRIAGRYDAVVDTCGFFPRDVAASCRYVRSSSPDAAYVFISSINAYRDDCPPGADESAPVWDTGDPDATEITPENYGPLKASCERTVAEAFAERATIVRPGLIVGPYDGTDRFTYWVRRVARGGTTLAPGLPQRRVQLIDARDLAEWIVALLQARRSGSFNATGPGYDLTMGALLDECRDELRSGAEFAWASEEFLREHQVAPWTEMPLFVPAEEGQGWDTISSARAVAAGLAYRPLRATVCDTWEWDRGRDQSVPMKSGITAEREAALLAALAAGAERSLMRP